MDITIDIVNDTDIESDENFTIALSNSHNADLGTNSIAAVTIFDDDAVPPESPEVGVVDNQNGTAKISWTDVENETGYDVQREKKHKKRESWSGLTIVGSTGDDVVLLTDASGTGTFRWRVRSKNDAGSSDWSALVEKVVTDNSGSGDGGGGKPPKPCRGNNCN